MATTPDYAGVEDSIKQGYNAQRQKAAQAEGANLQGQRDALARRQAQLGGGPSGAFVKAEQQAGNDSAQRVQQANASINDTQAAEMRALKQTQLGQQFATSERQGSQGFQSGEADKGRAFAKSERQGAEAHSDVAQERGIGAQKEMQQTGINSNEQLQAKQILAQQLMQDTGISAQAAMQKVGITSQQDMQKTENQFKANLAEGDRAAASKEAATQRTFIANSAEAERAQQDKVLHEQQVFAETEANKERNLKISQFAEQMGLSRAEFDQSVKVDGFNMQMADKMFKKKDMLEGFFDNFSVGNIQTAFNGKNGGGMFDGSDQSLPGLLGF